MSSAIEAQATSQQEPKYDKANMRRISAASIAGAALEWFDFIMYGIAAALVFGPLFFPSLEGLVGTLAAFAAFAVGFIARPLGGIIAGNVGDKWGRKPPLVASMVVIGVASVGIGLLPTYEAIGVGAPILLVLMRLLQGLGMGAQWGGGALLLVEHAPVERRGFFGSLIQTGGIIGVAAANGAFILLLAVLSTEDFMAWGWRLPFIAGLFIVAIGIYLQLKIEDTPVFQSMREESAQSAATAGVRKSPLSQAVRHHWRQILKAAGAFLVVNAAFYILINGMLSYGVSSLGMDQSAVLGAVLLAGVTQIVTIPLFGALSDRWGRRRQYLIGTVLLGLYAFPLFWMVNTGSVVVMFFALLIGFTIHAVMFGPQPAMFAEMFPADVRFSGASLGYQIASVFGGGLAPFIMTSLLLVSGSYWPVPIYLIVLAAITFISVFTMKETFRRDLYKTS
jgi:MFS transporter, MHS family, shikimate and dehydroshikimate transport protein